MLKQILLSFMIAMLLMLALWSWMTNPYSLVFEGSFFRLASTVRHSLSSKADSNAIEQQALFINTGSANELIASDDGLGTQVISDRKKLDSLLHLLNKFPSARRYIICDLLFDKESPYDSSFAATIKQTLNIYFPEPEPGSVGPVQAAIDLKRKGFVHYSSVDQWWKLSDMLLKFPLIANDTVKSLPLILYEDYTNSVTYKKAGLLWVNGKPSINNIMIDEHVSSYSLKKGADPNQVYSLDEILLDLSMQDKSVIDPIIAKEFIVIGDFERDTHKTAFGDVSGPVIVFNIFASLVKEENQVRISWIFFLLTCFTAIVQFALFAYHSEIFIRTWKDFAFFIDRGPAQLLFYIVFLSIVGVLSYWLFNIAIEIMATIVMFTFILKLYQCSPVFYEKIKKVNVRWSDPVFKRYLRLGFVLLLLILISLIVTAQPIKVLNIVGGKAIKFKNDTLKKGDFILTTDQIRFSNPRVVVPVYITGKGVFYLGNDEYSKKNKDQSPELWVLVKKSLVPLEKRKILAGRAGSLNSVFDVQNHFRRFSSDSSRLLIIDDILLPLNKEIAGKSGNNYFFMQFTWNDEQINKRLSFVKTGPAGLALKIDTALLKVDGKQIDMSEATNWKILYYDGDNADPAKRRSTFLTTLNINIIKMTTLNPELCILADHEPSKENWMDLVKNYIAETYGLTDEIILTNKLSAFSCK